MKGSPVLSGNNRVRRLFAVDEGFRSQAPGPGKPSVIDPQVKQCAIEWLITLESPEDVYKYWPRFQSWLNERPENREMFLWVERTWHEAGMLISQQSGVDSKGMLGLRDRWARARRKVRRRRLVVRAAYGVVACVPLVFALSYYFNFAPKLQHETEYTSASDAPKSIVLADDSTVNLNINSRVRASLGWNTRELELERGEGIFEVKKDRSSRPFIVHANAATIRATGTEFSVTLRRDGKVVTAVSQGSVAVTPNSLIEPETAQSKQQEVAVHEGEQVTVDMMGRVQRAKPGLLAIQRQFLWKDGLVSLDQRPLTDWVALFNDYNQRKLVVVDPSIGGIPISGVFRYTEPDTFVQALQAAYGIQSTETTSRSDPGVAVIELRATNKPRARNPLQ